MGTDVGWAEAIRLVQALAGDPGNRLTAAMNGWAHPWSREAIILADLFDLTYRAAGVKNPKPYPRPWPDRKAKRQMRPAARLTQADVLDALARAGHDVAASPSPSRPPL